MKQRRIAWLVPALSGAVLLVGFSPLRALLFGAHLRAVVPGEVYRSAQPSLSTLERWIDDYGLRTVVNLQGTQRRKPWAVAERKAAEARGLDFHFLRLHPKRMPAAQDMRRLLELIETSPRPILLHCRLGVGTTSPQPRAHPAGDVALRTVYVRQRRGDACVQRHLPDVERKPLRMPPYHENPIRRRDQFACLYLAVFKRPQHSHEADLETDSPLAQDTVSDGLFRQMVAMAYGQLSPQPTASCRASRDQHEP